MNASDICRGVDFRGLNYHFYKLLRKQGFSGHDLDGIKHKAQSMSKKVLSMKNIIDIRY